MGDNSSNPNIEWKKGSIGVKETITLKTNLTKVVEYEAKKQNIQRSSVPISPAELPKGLKKIRKKIKDVFDEEEEEEEEYVVLQDIAMLEQDRTTLLSALSEKEKKQLIQQETLNNTRMQQDAGKMEAIMQTEKMLKDAGLPKLKNKVKAAAMMDVRVNQDTAGKIIQNTMPKKLNLSMKKLEQMSIDEKKNLVNGISLVKQVGGEKALQETKVEELVRVGDKKTEEKEVAKLIMEKTGRKKAKAPSKTKHQSAQKELEKQIVNTRQRTRGQRTF